MKIDVVLPSLGGETALPRAPERMPDGCRPIVVDDGSTDGSPRAAGTGAVRRPGDTPPAARRERAIR
ncbi:hypothetical protein [Streptosporangium sp. LJ11]|uniref:hypothetical protein n=1 Tax=Streptosporangium sp. LJ11 TaxID=3436927 RepID=UPI003F7A0207